MSNCVCVNSCDVYIKNVVAKSKCIFIYVKREWLNSPSLGKEMKGR